MISFVPTDPMRHVQRVTATVDLKDGAVNTVKRKAVLVCLIRIVQVAEHATVPLRHVIVTQGGLDVDVKNQHVPVLRCAVVMVNVTLSGPHRSVPVIRVGWVEHVRLSVNMAILSKLMMGRLSASVMVATVV